MYGDPQEIRDFVEQHPLGATAKLSNRTVTVVDPLVEIPTRHILIADHVGGERWLKW